MPPVCCIKARGPNGAHGPMVGWNGSVWKLMEVDGSWRNSEEWMKDVKDVKDGKNLDVPRCQKCLNGVSGWSSCQWISQDFFGLVVTGT